MSYIKPSSGYMMTTAEIHSSRTPSRQSQLETSRSDTMSTDNFFIDSYHSQDSANSYRSADINLSKFSYDNSSSMNSPESLMVPRRGSHTLQTEPIFIGRNELELMRVPRTGPTGYEYESHSLPRRTCIHHKSEEYHTHSLPRREHHHHYVHEHSAGAAAVVPDTRLSNGSMNEQINADAKCRLSTYQDAQPSYVNVNTIPDTYSLSRRSSTHQQVPSLQIITQQQQHHVPQQQPPQVPPTEELCSTCSSETGSESETCTDEEESETEHYDQETEEKEIFIDFKPRLSPTPSPNSVAMKKKKLMKAMSEGEILLDDNGRSKHKTISASEEDLQQEIDYTEGLHYTDTPIRDEDIFKAENFLIASPDHSTSNRYTRETFRKRSVSLEDQLADEEICKKPNRTLKPNGSSPGSPGAEDGKSFHSSDDITRDHSDGNWNESQATVLPRPPR